MGGELQLRASDALKRSMEEVGLECDGDHGTVSLSVVKELQHRLVRRAKEQGQGTAVWLHDLLRGSAVELPRPPSRPPRDPAVESVLAAAARSAEEREYAGWVEDCIAPQRDAAEAIEGRTVKAQIGIAVNVVMAMFTGGVLGYAASKPIVSGPTGQAIGAVVGVILALLVEVWLFVIRSHYMIEEQASHKFRLFGAPGVQARKLPTSAAQAKHPNVQSKRK